MASPHPPPSLSDIHEFFFENDLLWFPAVEALSSSPSLPPPSPREYKVFELPPYVPSFAPLSSFFESETATFELAVDAPLPLNKSSTFASEEQNHQYPQFNYDHLLPFGDAADYYNGHQIAEYAPIATPPPPAPVSPADDIEFGCAAFECRLCLNMAKQPVVTACGHLYCWPCLYKWMSHSRKIIKERPFCRDGINEDVIFPILGSNDEEQLEADIPPRPRTTRRTC